MRAPLVVAALSIALPAYAQAPAPVPRRPVKVESPYIRGNGHAQTHDGRVFVVTRSGGWFLRVLRPEALRADADGVPVFGQAAFSDWVLLEANGTPDSGMNKHNAVALVPDPVVQGENPYPSDAQGNPRADGDHATYALRLFATKHKTEGVHARLGARDLRIVLSRPGTVFSFARSTSWTSPQTRRSTEKRISQWPSAGTRRISHRW